MRLVKKEISLGQIRKRKRKSFQETQKNNNIWQLLLYYEIYMVVAREWHSMAKCEILSNLSGQISFLSGIDIQKRTGLMLLILFWITR